MLATLFRAVLLVAALVLPSGCAGSVESWIVQTRNHQGDLALSHGNLPEAALAYRLALQVNPRSPHARQGAIAVQLALAQSAYRAGKLDAAV
ncbi:MAG: hypothetical protein JOY59_11125 [Candidatus Eremiobacteraeota bacterium]|nr:hypothetical protein [Candidatus Eremiobacteraeota bacterium]